MYNNKQAKNFTSSTFIPKRHVNNFTTQPDNSQHFNNMNHCAQGLLNYVIITLILL